MITIVFDKNLMRAPAMEEFLAMDRNHAVALSDWTIIEMQKKNAFRYSLCVLIHTLAWIGEGELMRWDQGFTDQANRSTSGPCLQRNN